MSPKTYVLLFFPITSSNRGGSEDWTFQRSTTFTSSEAGKNDPDMRQQGVFLNQNTLSQTQIYYSYVTAVLTAGPTRFYTGSSSATASSCSYRDLTGDCAGNDLTFHK